MAAVRLKKGITLIIEDKDGTPRYRKIKEITMTPTGLNVELFELGHSGRRWAKVKPLLGLFERS